MISTNDLLSAALGGALIGAASLLLLALNGRIAGISGILQGVMRGSGLERAWRGLFLFGLVLGAWLALWIGFATPAPTLNGASLPWYLIAGLLVGYGTRLGNGCTSGHGVCGLARLSPRSLVAVLVFMGCGMLVATIAAQTLWVLP